MNRLGYTAGAVAVFVLIVGLLIGGAAAMGAVTGLFFPLDGTTTPTPDVEDHFIQPLPSEGSVAVTPEAPGEAGLVLIDNAHGNNFENEEIQELRSALVAYGHDVKTVGTPISLESNLEDADALVVIDPGSSYSNRTATAVREFAADDGRVLLLGEPDRQEVVNGQLTPAESEINSLAHRIGISFGADHLYDMEANDGNHRNVIVTPTDDELLADVGQAVISIGTHVSANDGEPLLQTSPNATRAASETSGQFTVAVRNESIVAVGDTSFIGPNRFNVADNNVVIAALVEFLSGEDE